MRAAVCSALWEAIKISACRKPIFPKTKFADVAGEEAAVTEVEEIKDFLKDPTKYRKLGARIPSRFAALRPSRNG